MSQFRIEVIVDPRRATAGAKKVERGLARVEKRASGLQSTLGRAFAAATILVGLGQGIRLLADFSQEMSTVRAITQATNQEFEELSATAQELGSTTRFSASQAAEGMVSLARAGFDANETMKSIEGTLQLAQAGALDLGSAADIATNVLTGFGLEVEEISRVVDVLALGANSANTDVRQFGEAMKFVAPVAAGLGVSLEETAAIIETMANAGLKGGLAGRGLRTVMAQLQSPADELAKLLGEDAVAAGEFSVETLGLVGAIEALQDAGVTATNVFDLLENSAATAFLAITGQKDALPGLISDLENAEGSAARLAETMDANLNGALLSVKSAYQGLVLQLGENEGAVDSLESLVRDFADGLRFLTANVDVTAKVLTALAVAAILGALIPALATLAAAILANPLTLLPAIIALAAGAVFAFRDDLAELEIGGKRVGTVVVATFNAIKDRVQFVLPVIFETAKIVFEDLLTVTRFAFDEMGKAATATFEFFSNAFTAIFGSSGDGTSSIKDFANFTIAIFKTIGDVINGFIDSLIATFTAVADFDFSAPFESAKRVSDTLLASTLTGFDKIVEEAQSNFQTDFVGAMADVGGAAADALFSGFEGLEGGAAIKAFFDIGGDINERIAALEAERIAKKFAEELAIRTAVATATATAAQAVLFGAGGDVGGAGVPESGVPTETEPPTAAQTQALEDQENVLASIQGPMDEYMRTLAALNQLQDDGRISAEEYNLAMLQLDASSAGLTNTIGGGLKGGLAEVKLQLSDVSGVVQTGVVNAFGEARGALVDFARTGKLSFDGLVSSILDSLATLAVNQLFSSLLSGAGGGAEGGFFSTLLSGFGGGKAHGASNVGPEKTFLVGERGPELFTPPGRGDIVPAGETAAILQGRQQQAPVVNVNVAPAPVTVVDDPRRVIDTMRSRDGQEAQMVNLRDNKAATRGTLSR